MIQPFDQSLLDNQRRSGEETPPRVTLCAADAGAVDALLQEPPGALRLAVLSADFVGAPPMGDGASEQAARIAQVEKLLHVLAVAPAAEVPSGLLATTLQAVRAEKSATETTWSQAQPLARYAWLHQRVLELGALGATAALLLAVLVLGLRSVRQNALRTACADNLRSVGRALSQYSVANGRRLPAIARPSDGDWLPRRVTPPGLPFRRSADAHSNTQNLAPLLRDARYVRISRLLCPGQRPTAPLASGNIHLRANSIGYSYLNQFGPYDHHWNGRQSEVVLADRNPLFAPEHRRSNPMTNSPNHGGAGQNILCANGTVSWTTSPNVGPIGDNIWTLGRPCEVVYNGTEVSHTRRDIILSP